MRDKLPIGIFDSGAGGLLVMKSMMEILPNESIIYFGDTARLPYGDKSKETIEKYTRQCVNFLLEHPVKMVVIACNTASSLTSPEWKSSLPIPIADVLQPSAQKACRLTKNQRIGVLGTHATIRSGSYQKAIHERLPNAEVISVACPLFVPLAEEMLFDHQATHLLAKEYLAPIIANGCDTIILGCTHYPLLKKTIAAQLPKHMQIIDSAECCAESVKKHLEASPVSTQQAHQFFVTDDSTRFQKLACAFLPPAHAPHNVQLIHVD